MSMTGHDGVAAERDGSSTTMKATRDVYTAGGNQHITLLEAGIVAGTLGPFVTAFCTELGKRFGGTVADWVSHMRIRPKPGESTGDELVVEVDDSVTVIEFNDDLPDEAKLLLLDLDVEAEGIRGNRLTWNAAARVWISRKSED
jgi:hypothetical protein